MSYRPDFTGDTHQKKATVLYDKGAAFTTKHPETLHPLQEPLKDGKLSYAGRVAIITGGGRGIGRAHCKLLASRGAKVVVNNRTKERTDEVVAEIIKAGGTAVANYHDVATDPEKILEAAIHAFGRIDIVVCNAGQLMDRKLENMKIEEFTALVDTHLVGHFRLLKAAWPHFLKNQYGRVVIISSHSGMHGNPGQSNYGGAKSGLVAMSQALALEGQPDNIVVNVITTEGYTRMVDGLNPKAMQWTEEALLQVPMPAAAPVSYMSHESWKRCGGMFRAVEGHITCYRWQSDDSFVFVDPENEDGALECVAAQWPAMAWFENVSYPGEVHHAKHLPVGNGRFGREGVELK